MSFTGNIFNPFGYGFAFKKVSPPPPANLSRFCVCVSHPESVRSAEILDKSTGSKTSKTLNLFYCELALKKICFVSAQAACVHVCSCNAGHAS
jgi:hypothetical protein